VQDLILVVGAGTMGAGIAYVAARGGYNVELIDSDPAALERALARIAKDAARAGDDAVLARVVTRQALPDSTAAVIAIEAVPERAWTSSAPSLQRSIVRLHPTRCSRPIRRR
jgi:3-hydroxyacyl-CoA dehydrogenase